MERKWNQEKALREVAETRVKVLKKKLKAMEIQSGDADTREDESVGTHQTSGLHSRANSMDGVEYTDAIGAPALSGHAEATKFPGTTFTADGTATLETIDGTSLSVARAASILRPSTDGSPPRDNLGKKKLSNAQPAHGNGNSQKTGESGMVAGAKLAPQNRTNPSRTQPQLPPNVTNVHAANETGNAPSVQSEPIVTASTEATAPINFGPPPRPKTRLDTGTVITPNPSDFDPLRPTHQDQGGHTGFGLSHAAVPNVHGSADADSQQRMDTGMGAQAMNETADLMSFHSMSLQTGQSQFATDARVASAAVAPHVTMPYQDYPTNVSHEALGAFQKSPIPKQHGPTNSEHYMQPSTQHGISTESFSDTAAGHQLTDPFDELIQQRRPTNGSQ
jgi:hypothetical protein